MGTLADIAARLTEPSPLVEGTEARERTRLLSALLLVLVFFAAVTTIPQLLFVPDFFPGSFLRVAGAVAVLSAAYLASRTRYHLGAAHVAVAVPLFVASLQGWAEPEDRVWWAFLALTPVLATMFLSIRGAAAYAVLTMLALTGVVLATRAQLSSAAAIGPIIFHAVFNPLLIVAAAHRKRLEARSRAELAARDAELAESRRMEAVGRLAGGIAHDFNNVLAAIVANAELVRLETKTGTEAGESVQEILAAASRATSLTRQLLAFARRQPLVPVPVDLSRMLRELRPMAERLLGGAVTVDLHLPEAPAVVLVDPTQLEQVVMNLVVNARAAMGKGGCLTFDVLVYGETVALSVGDTGHGMDQVTRERAFEPFFTTRGADGGTGIGLATVRSIVERSGGRIAVASEVGVGTTFRIELPVCRLPLPARAEARPLPASQQVRLKVLLVEDQAPVLRALARNLEAIGFSVTAASSASEALALGDGGWDAVVTDVNMPGMRGPDFVAQLRERMAPVPVVFMSGDTSEAPSLDLSVTLAKPFTMAELEGKLAELLSRR